MAVVSRPGRDSRLGVNTGSPQTGFFPPLGSCYDRERDNGRVPGGSPEGTDVTVVIYTTNA